MTKEDLDCVVSVTTWKGRIYDRDTFKALYSLVTQTSKYKFKVVLTLSKEEFPKQYEELPEFIQLMYDTETIDIIWADGNYKALKKLYPIRKMYDCPIMTTDDDIICDNGVIDRFMDMHKRFPNLVLSDGGVTVCGLQLTGRFRLFPKDSFLDVDAKYFKECFQNAEDDLYIAVLMQYKGTKLKYLHSGLVHEIGRKMNDRTALRHIYTRINPNRCINALKSALKKDGLK